MTQTIYIDVLILVNLLVNYFLLLTVRGFLHVPVKRGRVFLGALAGAAGSLVIFLPQPHWSAALFFRLAISAVMVLACFFPVTLRMFGKLLGLLYLASFGFAGFMLALWAMGQSSGLLMNNGILYLPVSPMLLLVLAAAAYLVMSLIRRITGPREPKSRFCTVVIRNGGAQVSLRGKIDTGSTLAEPFSHRPALVVEKSAAMAVLPPCLQAKAGPESWEDGVRMIPYYGVSGEGYLPGFVPEGMTVTSGEGPETLENCWVAVCGQKLGRGEFQVLVPPAVFD